MTNVLAGFDLSSAYDIVVPARGKAIVKTDLAIAIPPNTYARIGKILQLEKQSMLCFFDYLYTRISSSQWPRSEEFH